MRMILKGIQQSIIFMLLVSTPIIASSQTLTWLGTLANGTNSTAYGVSDDGSMVVGEANGEGISSNAFLWKANNKEMRSLPNFGEFSTAYGISSNGSVIVGGIYENDTLYAVRWVNSTIIEKIITPPGLPAWAVNVSRNGETIIGSIFDGRGFVWSNKSNIKYIDTIPNYSIIPRGISDNGVVIGAIATNRYIKPYRRLAFRWKSNILHLFDVPDEYQSSANAVSIDGSIIVGWIWPKNYQPIAARWIDNEKIDTFPNGEIWAGYQAFITAISADGTVMLGNINQASYSFACQWYSDGRFTNLNEKYAKLLDYGSRLTLINATSSDGRFIVGQGYNSASQRNEGFILDTQGTPSSSTDVNEKSTISLYPITPNPINGISTIHFSTPEQTHATLSIVDILGRKVATLADQEFESGRHSQTFDASTLSGGLYYCQLKIGETIKSQKMIIMK